MLSTLVANQTQHPNRDLQVLPEGDGPEGRRGFNRGVKLDFPHFEGDNPTGWIFKATQHFEFHQTPPAHRLLMASYHDALDTGQFNTWETFIRVLLVRFGPTAYDDPMQELTHLKQTGTVSAYKAQFESLSNRLRGLSENHKLSCFLSSLKDEIRLPIRMLNPINLSAAFGLAKIQEEYLLSTKKAIKTLPDRFLTPKPTTPTQEPAPYNHTSSSSKGFSTLKRIPASIMDERPKKGLCYHCDEKWNPSHQCWSPKIYLIQGEEEQVDSNLLQLEPELIPSKDEGLDDNLTTHEPEISLAAISAPPTSNTMIYGRIVDVSVVVLVDSGSTHNFLDPSIVKKTMLTVNGQRHLSVKVANGEMITSNGCCDGGKTETAGVSI